MAEYKSSLYAISNRWTQKGQGEEMAKLSSVMTAGATDGFSLHSVQNVPIFGGFGGKQVGQALLVKWEKKP